MLTKTESKIATCSTREEKSLQSIMNIRQTESGAKRKKKRGLPTANGKTLQRMRDPVFCFKR